MATVPTHVRRAPSRALAATALGVAALGIAGVGLPAAAARSGQPAATVTTSAMSLPTVPPAARASVSANGPTTGSAPGPSTASTPTRTGVTVPLPSGTYSDLHNFGRTSRLWARWHTGTDLAAPCGTPVLAANAGTVTIETGQRWAGPWLVKVSAGPGNLTTWYGHMRGVTVASGQSVQPGEQIGVVGDLGNATGCHLHFEVHPTGGSMYADAVDPSAWLERYADAAPASAPSVQQPVQQPVQQSAPQSAPRQTDRPTAYAVPQGAVGEQKVKHPRPIVLPDLLGDQPQATR